MLYFPEVGEGNFLAHWAKLERVREVYLSLTTVGSNCVTTRRMRQNYII